MSFRDVVAGRASVIIGMRNNLSKGARQVQRSLDQMGQRMAGFGKIGLAMGGAISAPLVLGAKKFADFDDAMRAAGAAATASESQLASMADVAQELGRTTSFTAVEVANLMTNLGRAGFKPDQINEMTAAVLDLSRATGTDAALSAGIVSATLNQFGLAATDAARAADVLTLAANSTFNTVEGLGESLKYAGPVAAQLGLSLEDTVAVLGSLGNVGIQGSEAGTALRRLGVIAAASGKELKSIFGISNTDAAGNLKPLVQVMDEIGVAVSNLPVAERTAKMEQAFGLLGITSAQVLSNTGSETMALAESLRQAAGTASKTAVEMDAGLGGSLRKIMSAAEGVQLALGQALEGPLQSAIDSATTGLGYVTEFIQQNQGLIVSVGAVGASLAAAGGGLVGLGIAAQAASLGVGGLVTIAGALVSPLGLAAAASAGLGYALVSYTSVGQDALAGLQGTFGNLKQSAETAIGGIAAAIENGDIEAAWEIATTFMEKAWLDLTMDIRNAWTELQTMLVDAGLDTADAIGQSFVALGDFLEGLLDGYKSYYDEVYNFVTDLGGDLTGVRTIGERSSGFDANIGGAEQSFRSQLESIRQFGRNMSETAQGQQRDNRAEADRTIQSRFDRSQRIAESINQQSGEQVATNLVNSAVEKLGGIGDELKRILGGEAEQAAAASSSPSQMAADAAAEGATAGATFSAVGAMIAGLGFGPANVDERIARTNEQQLDVLKSIEAGIVKNAAAMAVEKGVGFANDFASGVVGVAGDLMSRFMGGDSTATAKTESSDEQVKVLQDIAKNTKQPPVARFA